MPRYFFNVMNDVQTSDTDGRELPDLQAARGEAQKDIDEIVSLDFSTLGHDWSKSSIEIVDRDGTVLLVVPFFRN